MSSKRSESATPVGAAAPEVAGGAAAAIVADPTKELSVASWNIHKHRHGSIEAELKALIIAGDFNTWSHSRMKVVNDFTKTLDLVEVKPGEDGGKTGTLPQGIIGRALGFAPDLWLDRIFVRGFVPVEVSWKPEYQASDHVPIIARLRWA